MTPGGSRPKAKRPLRYVIPRPGKSPASRPVAPGARGSVPYPIFRLRKSPVFPETAAKRVDRYLETTARTMQRLGSKEGDHSFDTRNWWKKNKRRYAKQLRTVGKQRQAAINEVASFLADHVSGFDKLKKRFIYDPDCEGLTPGRIAVVGFPWKPGKGDPRAPAHLGDLAFANRSRLTFTMLHEGRHLQQIKRGGWYNQPTILSENDADIFTLRHRRLAGISTPMMGEMARRVQHRFSIDDHLARREPLPDYYRRRTTIRIAMDRVKRADLDLQWSFLKPQIERELHGKVKRSYWDRPERLTGPRFSPPTYLRRTFPTL